MKNVHLERKTKSAMESLSEAVDMLVLEILTLEDEITNKDAEIEKLQNKIEELYEVINENDN